MGKLSDLISAELSVFFRQSRGEFSKLKDLQEKVDLSIRSLGLHRKELSGERSEINKTKREVQMLEMYIKGLRTNYLKEMPCLAKAYADCYAVIKKQDVDFLLNKKPPAILAAEKIKESNKEKKKLVRRLKEAEYQLEYFKYLIPNLEDVAGGFDEELLDEDYDAVSNYLSKDEYNTLSVDQRNQLALDKYLARNHSKGHIGKMYERYIGYLYEQKGWQVEYFGIKEKLEDMGRDLICRGKNRILIIQCKCWSKASTLHENVICQLFGTTKMFEIEQGEGQLFGTPISPVFITTTKLSDKALCFANKLGVEVLTIPLKKDYPMIKCNISPYGEKIYHLPFDQQYNSTKIDKAGEFYALTVAEAVEKGFRRAYRHAYKA